MSVEKPSNGVASAAKRARLEMNEYKRPLDAWKLKRRAKPILVNNWEVTPSPVSSAAKHSFQDETTDDGEQTRPVKTKQTELRRSASDNTARREADSDGGGIQRSTSEQQVQTSWRSSHLSAATSARRSPRVCAPRSDTNSNIATQAPNPGVVTSPNGKKTSAKSPRKSPRLVSSSPRAVTVKATHSADPVLTAVSPRPNANAMQVSQDRSPRNAASSYEVTNRPKELKENLRTTSNVSRQEVTLSREIRAELERRRLNVTKNYSKINQSEMFVADRTRDPEVVTKRQEYLRRKRALLEVRVADVTTAGSQEEAHPPPMPPVTSMAPQIMNDVSLLRVSDFLRRKHVGQISDLDVAHSLLMAMAKELEVDGDNFVHFKDFVKTVEKELAKSVGAALEFKQKKDELRRSRQSAQELYQMMMDRYDQKQTLIEDYEKHVESANRRRRLAVVGEWADGLQKMLQEYRKNENLSNGGQIIHSTMPMSVREIMDCTQVVRRQPVE